MQPHVNDISDQGWIAKAAISAVLSILPEGLVYPLDRLKVRGMARQQNQSNSFMHLKETNIILKEIIAKDKSIGLLYGIKGALDVTATAMAIRFLTYDFIIGREKNNLDNYGQQKKYRFADILCATAVSSTIGAILSQPSEILKIKVQLEPLGDKNQQLETYKQKSSNILQYHRGNQKIFMIPGLIEKILFKNAFFLTEIFLFFELRHKINKTQFIYENEENKQLMYSLIAGLSSMCATAITHPLEFFYHRSVIRSLQGFQYINFISYIKVIQQNEGIMGIYKGIAPSIMKNGIQNMTFMFLMQGFINYQGNDLRRRNIEKIQMSQKYKRGNE